MTTMQDMPATATRASMSAILVSDTRWAREAREALRLAGERGLRLDEDQLIVSDVRDLQALVTELRLVPIPRAHVPHTAHRLRLYLGGCAAV